MEIRKSALIDRPSAAMFDLIEGAEHYPEFMPWCAEATILARDDTLVVARIGVDYHGARFQFTTRNPKMRPHWMAVGFEDGPFRRFEGEWQLRDLGAGACRVEFRLRYEIDGTLQGLLAGRVFDSIADTLVDAFARRADQAAH